MLESSHGTLSSADYTPSAPKGGRGKSKGKGGAQQWVPNGDGIDGAVGVDGGGDNGGGGGAAAAVSAAAPGAAAEAGVAQKGGPSRSTPEARLAGQPPRLPFPRAGHAAASATPTLRHGRYHAGWLLVVVAVPLNPLNLCSRTLLRWAWTTD